MKKGLLMMMAALMVAVGANAQARKITGMESCYKNLASKMEAKVAAPATANVVSKVNTAKSTTGRRAAADVAGTYILEAANYDRDFTSSSQFTIEAETGTITLDQYDKDETTGQYPTFDYNVKLTGFTDTRATAYGFYDETESTITIPVQTLFTYSSGDTDYGRIVFSSFVLTKEGDPALYGYSMTLIINSDGTVEIDEGDFTEEAQEDPELEGAYIGGYYNFMPDYLNASGYPYAWNHGLDAEIFIPNATLGDVECHLVNGAWGSWTKTQHAVNVEDYGNELVVHNFFSLIPLSITIDGDKASVKCPVRAMDSDYADEGEEPNYIQIHQWDATFENIIDGTITGNVGQLEDGRKILEFYDTEYKEAWTDENGDHEAGDYIITDYTKWFMVHSNWGENGAYWWGEARNVYLIWGEKITGINAISNVPVKTTGKTYNLMGQEVNPAAKGIVIRDGKKMLVK